MSPGELPGGSLGESSLALKSRAVGQPWASPLSSLGLRVCFYKRRVEGPAGELLHGGDEPAVEGQAASSALPGFMECGTSSRLSWAGMRPCVVPSTACTEITKTSSHHSMFFLPVGQIGHGLRLGHPSRPQLHR